MRLGSLADPSEDDRVVALRKAPRRAPGVDAFHPRLAGIVDPAGPLQAAIGELRVQLAGVRRADGTPARLLAIAGIDAPDEAALLTAALAVVTARAGYETLVVDACLDRPALHTLFGCENASGVTTLVSGRTAEAIRPTGQPGLSVIAAGPPVAGDESLIDGAMLFATLRVLAERFHSILVLGGGEAGSIASTSEGFDGTVLVVRRDVSSIRRLGAAAAALADRGTHLIGVVRVD